MYGAVGAHGHGCAEDIDGFGGTSGEGDDFGDFFFFALAEADGGFDGELVEGVHAVLHALRLNGRAGFVDAGFDLRGKQMLAGPIVGRGGRRERSIGAGEGVRHSQ